MSGSGPELPLTRVTSPEMAIEARVRARKLSLVMVSPPKSMQPASKGVVGVSVQLAVAPPTNTASSPTLAGLPVMVTWPTSCVGVEALSQSKTWITQLSADHDQLARLMVKSVPADAHSIVSGVPAPLLSMRTTLMSPDWPEGQPEHWACATGTRASIRCAIPSVTSVRSCM